MGRGNACPNAPESTYMGWSIPASGAGMLDKVTLLPGVARKYLLPASYLTGKGNFLRVVPNWLPTYEDSQKARNLYIAVRVAKGGDAELSPELSNQVHIHEVNGTQVRRPCVRNPIMVLMRCAVVLPSAPRGPSCLAPEVINDNALH